MMRLLAAVILPVILPILFPFFLSGCGVQGDPEPPDTPPRLGHGGPTYDRATQDLAQPNLKPVHPKEDAEKEE